MQRSHNHLSEIAQQLGIEQNVMHTLAHQVAIASVGPVMTESLETKGLRPDIIPQNPKMGALIKAASEQAAADLAKKLAPKRG